MRSANRIVLASAGSGKTTSLVSEANAGHEFRTGLVTYTLNGKEELVDKSYELDGVIAPHVAITTWYTFVLTHFVRPFQNYLYIPRVKNINFIDRIPSYPHIPKTNVAKYYFSSRGRIWKDRVTDFACQVIKVTNGLPVQRIEKIYRRIYIDEAQDLSGWDLELVEHLLRSNVEVCLMGDHRQATFSTNDNPKNKGFSGENILLKFEEWERAGLGQIEHQAHSYRCNQQICDFADAIFPHCHKTKSRNGEERGHDGLFFVRQSCVEAYAASFAPQPLRYNRTKKINHGRPLNFGESKGLTFDRTLIYPHGPFEKYLATGKLKDAGKELAKIYVAITRARFSVGFVVPDKFASKMLPYWAPDDS
ncbi:AAA family ATPase [Rhizobium leguminosarum]|uniref:UvrD-helicase domain-containing protein n=1 Tax=Rhizobium leguminosarum TaxID=384 RepID=UPI0013C199B5|nr:UvrD-helicase domain-containing protein [Rhizobium leguminosarum]NEH59814.1 AAA family ATPase [Rhizobium leguminosarum]